MTATKYIAVLPDGRHMPYSAVGKLLFHLASHHHDGDAAHRSHKDNLACHDRLHDQDPWIGHDPASRDYDVDGALVELREGHARHVRRGATRPG